MDDATINIRLALAAVLQLFELVVGMLIYYPFVKSLDKQYILKENNLEAN